MLKILGLTKIQTLMIWGSHMPILIQEKIKLVLFLKNAKVGKYQNVTRIRLRNIFNKKKIDHSGNWLRLPIGSWNFFSPNLFNKTQHGHLWMSINLEKEDITFEDKKQEFYKNKCWRKNESWHLWKLQTLQKERQAYLSKKIKNYNKKFWS